MEDRKKELLKKIATEFPALKESESIISPVTFLTPRIPEQRR